LFVIVTLCGPLVVPTAWLENVSFDVESDTDGRTAVPVRVTVCGLLPALSVTMSAAVRVPEALGLKITLMVQVEPAATDVQVLFCEKSAAFVPEIATPVTVMLVTFPLLVMVTLCEPLLVSTCWLVKVSVEVDGVAVGAVPSSFATLRMRPMAKSVMNKSPAASPAMPCG